MGLLSVMAILGALPAAAEDDPVLLQASTQDIQAPEPSEPPPAQAPASTGQWVYTSEYGWVWMPYSSTYTYAPPDGSTPSMYVYYPDFGWCWLVAPWLWGLGPSPFFGVLGPGWYGLGRARAGTLGTDTRGATGTGALGDGPTGMAGAGSG